MPNIDINWKSDFDNNQMKTLVHTSNLEFKSVSGAESSAKKITCNKLTNVYDTILQSSDNLNEELDIQFKKFLKKLNSYFREIDLIIEFVTLTDVILTKAFISKKYNYCKHEE